MSSFRQHLSSLLIFDFSTLDRRDALRGALVTAAVTAIPVAYGDFSQAIPLSIGAVFAAIAEAGQPFGRRWKTMLGTTIALALAGFLGAALSDVTILAILATIPVAFICGMSGALGQRVGVGGLLALVIFTIYVGIPVPMDDAPSTAALIALGGLTQTLATVVMGLIRHQHRAQVATRDPIRPISTRLRNPVFVNHALRLTVVITIATTISETIDMPHPYWLPMSVAWMSKPEADGTVNRVIHRLTGTIIGLLVATAVDLFLSPAPTGYLLFSLIGAAMTIAFIWANYAVAVTGVTIWVVSLFAMVGDPIASTMDARFLATVAAAVLVLAALVLGTALQRTRARHRPNN